MEYVFTVESIADQDTPYERRSVFTYESAVAAVKAWNSYVDYGFASTGLRVVLTEPNGQIHEKYYRTQGAQFESRSSRVQVM